MYKFVNPKEKRLTIYNGDKVTLGIASGTTLEGTVFTEPVTIISIRTMKGGQPADLTRSNADAILYLAFFDYGYTPEEWQSILKKEESDGNEVDYYLWDAMFSSEQAEQVLDFAEKHKNIPIICQCEAGISRSSGMASALSVIYNNTDDWVFKNPFFKPNMAVRRMILNVYMNRVSS